MSVPAPFATQIAAFPAVLREVIEAELAAGNAIVEIARCFPAPPAGAYVKLAKPITTRPRATTATLDFHDRNTSIYSGEWSDPKRFYFVLEPPRPPPPEPDMDAIRDAANGASAGNATAEHNANRPARLFPSLSSEAHDELRDAPDSVVGRFEASMHIDYEKWHDGIGYDLTLFKEATPGELEQIEATLIARVDRDWREVEALAALDTPRARRTLKNVMKTGNAVVRAAVMRYAPELVPETQRTAALVDALTTADFYAGLSEALNQVAKFHPPEIMDALFRGALERKGDVAIHFAAMLMYLHGKANSPFDWIHRPFFLRFGAKTRSEREALFRELCEKVGVDPEPYLPKRAV